MKWLCFLGFFFFCLSRGLYAQEETLSGQDSARQLLLERNKEELAKMKQDQQNVKSRIENLEKEIQRLATKDQYLAHSISAYVNLTQSEFSNWLPGGESFIAVLLGADYGLKLEDKPQKILWDTRVGLLLGFKNTANLGIVKSNDFLSIRSNVAYGLFDKLAASGEFYLRSQFFETVDYTNQERPITTASFFAPAYMTLGIGAKWNPKPWISLYASPLTIQATAVANPAIDPKIYGLDSAQRLRLLGGWYINAESTLSLFEFVSLNARCILFQNYMTPSSSNSIDVDFRLKVDAKIAKYFYANLFVNLLYDERARIKSITTNGTDQQTRYSKAGIQVYENLGIGFSYILEKMN